MSCLFGSLTFFLTSHFSRCCWMDRSWQRNIRHNGSVKSERRRTKSCCHISCPDDQTQKAFSLIHFGCLALIGKNNYRHNMQWFRQVLEALQKKANNKAVEWERFHDTAPDCTTATNQPEWTHYNDEWELYRLSKKGVCWSTVWKAKWHQVMFVKISE